jgi:cysteine desulfurase
MIGSNYFDYAATTPLEPRVLAVMVPYLGDNFYNPSAGYLKAIAVKKELNEARSRIAKALGCKTPEVLFVAGGTEANNLAISGVMKQFPDSNLIVSEIEHDSVYETANQYKNKKVKVNQKGIIDLEDLKSKIDKNTALISVMFVNNELGTIQPIKQIAEIIHEELNNRRKTNNKLPLLFHTDASQAGNYLSLNVNNLGVDMLTLNGGKIYGPKQSAALYVSSKAKISPIIYGGGQERGLRSGTENVAAYVGLSVAVELSQKNQIKEQKRISEISGILLSELRKNIPDVVVNGDKNKIPNIVNVTLPHQDNETIMMKMDEMGYEIAVGSACKASNDEPSRVLMAIGLNEAEAESTIRISMGKYTTKEAVIGLVESLQKACQ